MSILVARHAQKEDENLEQRWQAMKARMIRKASDVEVALVPSTSFMVCLTSTTMMMTMTTTTTMMMMMMTTTTMMVMMTTITTMMMIVPEERKESLLYAHVHRNFALCPLTPSHIWGGWSHYTDTSEPVVGYGAHNMVTVRSGT
jgi:archaellum biogenesis protein FlaJ (TadC family)